MMKNIGHNSYQDNCFIPSSYWFADINESLIEEANEQVLSKLEDREPQYDESLMDLFWNAKGEFKNELESLFRGIAMNCFKNDLNSHQDNLIDTQKHLAKWLEQTADIEKKLILENG